MEAVGDRIKLLMKDKHLTQTQFAESLNLTQSHISRLCSGTQVLSDRTASDICREYGVSRVWLMEGIGDMYVKRTENEELAMLFADLLQEADDSFRKRFVAAMLTYPIDKLEALYDFVAALLKESQEKDKKGE